MPDTPKSDSPKSVGAVLAGHKAVVAAVCVAAVAVGGAVLYATGVIGPKEEDAGLKYATKGVMVLDGSDGIYEEIENNAIALEFKNDTYSRDGKTFACYLGNSALNQYDMFVAIYTDPQLQDMIYLSDLVPPGSGFEEITLDRELEEGDHRLYVAFTQVEDAATNTIHAQTLYTMDFHVLPD